MKFKWSDQHIELEPANPSSEILRANREYNSRGVWSETMLINEACLSTLYHTLTFIRCNIKK